MIRIVCVGKVKNREISSLISDYTTRISRYMKTERIEIKEERLKPDKKAEEGKRIITHLDKERRKIICLDAKGKKFSSDDFSKLLVEDLCFVIGGEEGISEDVLAKAKLRLSLSDMTFTHEMAELLVMEQIYRGISIQKGLPYHK